MTTDVKLALIFGVAGLALTWYIYKKEAVGYAPFNNDIGAGGVDGYPMGQIASGGNGHAGTPNHTATDAPVGNLANDVVRMPTLAIDPAWSKTGADTTTSASSA